MAVKYTTATKVRNFMSNRVAGEITDAMINVWIEEAEGIIDTWARIGSGTGSDSMTFDASKKPHLIFELAATALAASIAMGSSSVSFATMNQAVMMQETAVFWWEECRKIFLDNDNDHVKFIQEQ